MNYFAKCLNVKSNNIYINGFMMRFDAPFDLRNKLNWHQDSTYYMMSYPKYNAGVCWCAITKNNDDNGTLKFIPKSHSKLIKTIGSKKDTPILIVFSEHFFRNGHNILRRTQLYDLICQSTVKEQKQLQSDSH